MARILVIEDEDDIRHVLDYNLRQAGHEVLLAARGGDGLRLVHEGHPDLVLLDLMLPDLSGTEICRVIKDDMATRKTPVVMLTARGEEIDRVVGLELGADDYVTKPFSVRELILRIRAVLRRTDADAAAGLVIEFGCLHIDREAHRVWVIQEEAGMRRRAPSSEVLLTALEFRLLLTLYERKNRVRSRLALLECIWGPDSKISMRTVDAHVKRLREKLGDAGEYIETVRGIGYRFADTP